MNEENKSKAMISQRQAASFLGIDKDTLAKHRSRFKTQRLRKIILFDLAELTEFKNKFSISKRGIKSK